MFTVTQTLKRKESQLNKNIMSETTDSALTLKKLSYLVRVTTFIKGKTKNDFIEDCLLRSNGESQNAKHIIQLHYQLIEKMPQLKGKEFSDMLLLILNK